jgi:hypothetical protein
MQIMTNPYHINWEGLNVHDLIDAGFKPVSNSAKIVSKKWRYNKKGYSIRIKLTTEGYQDFKERIRAQKSFEAYKFSPKIKREKEELTLSEE